MRAEKYADLFVILYRIMQSLNDYYKRSKYVSPKIYIFLKDAKVENMH